MLKTTHSSIYSLVHRGANSRVAGNDVRVIASYTDCKVDVQRVDNHEITSIPLVTAGRVTSTTSGEVMVTLNQHAYHNKNKTMHSSAQIKHCKKHFFGTRVILKPRTKKFKGRSNKRNTAVHQGKTCITKEV